MATRVLQDYQGRLIRLTDERIAHILEHPEMVGMEGAIEETLARPQHVVQSESDSQARLYYRYYLGSRVGDKFLCVVVTIKENDAFILTAYMTDKVKKGTVLWIEKS
jgi:hypothetical protein